MLDSESLNKFENKFEQPQILSDEFFQPAAITDPGCERELNEDRYAVIESASGLVWVVCDGMGGVKGGELAAQLVIDSVKRTLDSDVQLKPEDALREAFAEANRIVVLRRQNQAFSQMGTTAVGAIFQDRQVTIVNIGDSRAYLISDGRIKQLTEDHTYVQQLVKSGQLREEEALEHPQAHVLTRAVGSDPTLNVELHNYWIWDVESPSDQDYLLFCTDGLYSMITDQEILDLALKFPPQISCSQMVELAKERGGYDNITVAVVPLVGKLRKAPPAGYVLPQVKKEVDKKSMSIEALKPFILKNFLMIVGLSLIALIIAVVLILLALTR